MQACDVKDRCSIGVFCESSDKDITGTKPYPFYTKCFKRQEILQKTASKGGDKNAMQSVLRRS